MFKTKYLFLDSPISVDLEKLTKKLESLSKQGWIVTKVGPTYLKLIYQAPQNLKYQLDYLPQADALTSDQDERITNYIHLCQECGWTYIDHNQHLFIFCADEQKEVLPLQTDVEIQNNMLISLTLKNHLLPLIIPCFVFWFNDFTDVLQYTTFSGNMALFLNPIFCLLLPFYFVLNLIQMIGIKRQSTLKFFKTLPYFLRLAYKSLIALLITMFILFIGFLVLENSNSTLPLALTFFIIAFIPMGLGLNYFIKKRNRSRKRNLVLLLGMSSMMTFMMLNLMIHMIFTISDPVANLVDYESTPIVTLSEILPEKEVRLHDPYFEHSQSFIMNNYYAYSDYDTDYYGFRSYELRSSLFKNQFLQVLLNCYNKYGNYTEPNPLLENSYLIYHSDSTIPKGIIIQHGPKLFVIESREVDFLNPSILNQTLNLIDSL